MLVSRGGMDSMLNTIWLIITALAFGGVVEKAGVLDRLITPIIEKAKADGALVASLVASIFATNVVTADQYIAIVLPGRMFKTRLRAARTGPVVLSRSVGGSATPTGRADPVEQLRRLHGGDARRRHVELCAVRVLQLREPAAHHRHRLRGHPDAARARGAGVPPRPSRRSARRD